MNCETCRYSGYGWHENECSRPTTECSYQPIEQPKPETKEVKKELNNSNACISRRAALKLGDNLRDDLPDDEQIAAAVMAHNEGIIEYQTKLSLLPSVQPTHTNNSNTLKSLDCVDRQVVVDALEKVADLFPWRVPGKRDTYDSYNEAWNDAIGRAEMEIEKLPSVQPDVPDTNVGDMISRQAAISTILGMTTFGNVHELNKFVQKYHLDGERMGGLRDAVFAIVNAPSVQPETCEGCKHLDKWENEVEYGYPSPCTRCKRRVEDHYER